MVDFTSQDAEWKTWLSQVSEFCCSNSAPRPNCLVCTDPAVTTGCFASNVAPLFVHLPGDNRPYVRFSTSHSEFIALLDTGANVSVLGANALLKIQMPLSSVSNSENQPLIVSTADGKPQTVSDIVELPVTFDNITRNVKFYVIPSITNDFILGMDFCKIFGLSVDFPSSSFQASLVPAVNIINTIKDRSSQTSENQQKLERITEKFKTLSHNDYLSETHLITHHIDTGSARPIKQRQYPLSPALQSYLNEEIDRLLQLGIIEKANSPWSSPVLLVRKKDNSYRMCFDGRKLNEVTVRDSYPLPRIDSILNKLRDSAYITSIDLKQAFFQIPLDPESRPKTAFTVHGRGLFQFRRMPFGLCNSAQSMQRLMDLVLGPEVEPYVFVYLDDIIIATSTFEKHLEILAEVYSRLQSANLTINIDKCQFCRESLSFLGFVVDKDGLRTDPAKVKSILEAPVPKNTTEVRRVLGLLQYYRRFIKDFSTISAPITALLHGQQKGQPIVWSSEADHAFKTLKQQLTSAPLLASPDFSRPFFIQTDASDVGIGAVLFQEDDGFEHPIAYASRSLSKTERKFTVTEKECLAVLFGVEHYRPYVEGTRFTVLTDHASLLWLTRLKDPVNRLARWCLRLSQFGFVIRHRKGSLNVPADFLSRSINLLQASELVPDEWYKNMIRNVSTNPDAFPNFTVTDQVLYKHVKPKVNVKSNLSDWKIVVPTDNRLSLISKFHDEPTSGHFGISKTLARISEFYYWPKMAVSVKRYINNCQVCGAHKAPNVARAGLMGQYKNISFPFQMLSVDFMGPFPRSKKGNTQLLVVTDWFTKYVLVKPLPNATASSVVKFLEQNVFLVFGVPQTILCDNAQIFKSTQFTKLNSDYKVNLWHSARHLSQVNPTERTNRVVLTAMSSYIKDDHRSWDENIFKIAQAINLSKHEVTAHAPAFLVFARNVPVDGTFYGPVPKNQDNIVEISDKVHREQDIENLPPVFEEVRVRLKRAYNTSKRYYDLRKRSDVFELGNLVWKKTYHLSDATKKFAAKLAPRYVLCKIIKVCSKVVYELEDMNGSYLGKWHIKDLKAFVGDDSPV